MAAGDQYLQWQRQQEQYDRNRNAAKKKATKPKLQQRQTVRNEPGWRAVIPAQDWVAPIPKHTGISQEPNAPWGVAIHDPLEKQFVTMSPAGFPVLRNSPVPRVMAPRTVASPSYTDWGSDYYPRSSGGGGGSYSYPSYTPTTAPYWWDPGLYNWRYGVSY